MIQTDKKAVYKAFGLRIVSEIALPELPSANQNGSAADIEITVDAKAEFRNSMKAIPYKHVVKGQAVMFYIPNNAYYCIKDGSRVIVSPLSDADEDLTRLYILGTCMGAILMQRGMYPLHGSAVAIDGKAYAFVGESGAGKSTLASTFISLGYPLVSDDLIAVSLDGASRTPLVTPSFPQQKLWQDSLQLFGMTAGDYRSIYGRETKYSVPVADHYFADPLPLAGVFELVQTSDRDAEIVRIENLDRLQTLFSHTFRQFLIPRLGLMEWHFNMSAAMANQISMFQLRRPEAGFTAPDLVTLILDAIQKEEFK